MRVFRPARTGVKDADEIIDGIDNPACWRERFGMAYEQARRRDRAGARAPHRGFDEAAFLRRPADADVLRLGHQQLRRAARCSTRWSTWRRRRARKAALQRDGAAHRAQVQRRGVQDPGQHGPGAPRPHRLRARGQRPLRARHAAEGGAHGQGAAAQHRGVLPDPAARAAGRGLRRRHHRHPQPRRAAARRHAHRRRDRCSSPGCPSSRRRCSARSRWPTRCAPSSCAPA